MRRTNNGILIPDVPIMAGGNLPNAVKGVSAGGGGGFDPRTPFYIDARETVSLYRATSGLQMSTDGGETWTDTAAGDLPIGKTYFRVASDQTTPLKPILINTRADYEIGGNINSLVKKDFENDTTCYNFYNDSSRKGFFQGEYIRGASNLILPATKLTKFCYRSMFQDCTSLTTAPELSAMTLAEGCYVGIFSGCTSLTTAPELPAMTLAEGCYVDMFNGCTSLTTAPELPAMTLADSCYHGMFSGCTSLTTAPELPATKLTGYCYGYMFQGCTSLTTAPELSAMTLAEGCYSGIFSGCTSLTTAPELPAMTLAEGCYVYMFQNCTSLTTAPALHAMTLADRCYHGMFKGCTSLTTAPELPATKLTKYCYYEMFSGCTNLNYIKCLATDISALGCTQSWVTNVASAGTFVKNPSMTDWTTGRNGIPTGWTVEEID